MNTTKIKAAVADAAAKLTNAKPPKDGPAAIGDVFVLPDLTDPIGLSWLVVNIIDDMYLIVPMDTAPFVGNFDCMAEDEISVARTGASTWMSPNELDPKYRVNYGLEETAKKCRTILGRCVRNKPLITTQAQQFTESDPDYEDHIGTIWNVCAQLHLPNKKVQGAAQRLRAWRNGITPDHVWPHLGNLFERQAHVTKGQLADIDTILATIPE
jgi:hypothetical protein